MKFKQLLQPYEIPCLIEVDPTFRASCTRILLVESQARRECFGNDMWQKLCDNLCDYTGTKEWCHGEDYGVGDIVLFDGGIYENTEEGNTQNPCEGGWKPARKFKEDCLNELWALLGVYLASLVTASSLRLKTQQIGANGATTIVTPDSASRTNVDNRSIELSKSGLMTDAEMAYQSIVEFLCICPCLNISISPCVKECKNKQLGGFL